MKRLHNEEPINILRKRIQVEMTVEEIAVIHAITGIAEKEFVTEAVEGEFSQSTVDTMNAWDIVSDLYDETEEILITEGVERS